MKLIIEIDLEEIEGDAYRAARVIAQMPEHIVGYPNDDLRVPEDAKAGKRLMLMQAPCEKGGKAAIHVEVVDEPLRDMVITNEMAEETCKVPM